MHFELIYSHEYEYDCKNHSRHLFEFYAIRFNDTFSRRTRYLYDESQIHTTENKVNQSLDHINRIIKDFTRDLKYNNATYPPVSNVYLHARFDLETKQ